MAEQTSCETCKHWRGIEESFCHYGACEAKTYRFMAYDQNGQPGQLQTRHDHFCSEWATEPGPLMLDANAGTPGYGRSPEVE